jgi:hypothetical protein
LYWGLVIVCSCFISLPVPVLSCPVYGHDARF